VGCIGVGYSRGQGRIEIIFFFLLFLIGVSRLLSNGFRFCFVQSGGGQWLRGCFVIDEVVDYGCLS